MNTQLINNQWHAGQGPAFNSVNPSNGEVVWQGNGASPEQVSSAIEAARAAQIQWADMPIEQRITILENFVAQLKEHSEEFASIIARETGKPLWEPNQLGVPLLAKRHLPIRDWLLRHQPPRHVSRQIAMPCAPFRWFPSRSQDRLDESSEHQSESRCPWSPRKHCLCLLH